MGVEPSDVVTARQGRDDGLVEAVAHRALGDGDVGEAASASRSSGSRSGPLATQKKRPTDVGGLQVLDRVADGDALLGRVAAGADVEGDPLRLARAARDQVVGVGGALDSLHRAADRAVVEEAQVVVAALAQQLVGLGDVDPAAHQQRELAARVPGRVPLQPAREALEEQLRDPGGDQPLGRGAVRRRAASRR